MESALNDISLKIRLTLEEMYFGVTKQINYKRKKPCVVCNKSGNCSNCSGKGIVLEESVEEIKIPAGIDKGMVLNFKNKGHFFIEKKKLWKLFSNKNSTSKDNFGGLIITIETIKHDIFIRDLSDLIYECRLKQSEINESGKEIEIRHLNDKIIKIQIPKNTVNGKIFRIKGLGFKNISGNETGNLLLVSKIIDG